MCWCVGGQTANMAEKGVAASGYGTDGTEYTWQIRSVSYSPVGDEVIPSNTKNTSLACHVECLQPESSFNSVQVSAPWRPTARTHVV